MTSDLRKGLTRRHFLMSGVAASGALAAPAVLAQTADMMENSTEIEGALRETSRNLSSFRALHWREYFTNLDNGAILCDLDSRCVHFWSADESVYRLYPSSVPISEDLTRRGSTHVTRKIEGPSWRPTPAMRERNPEWPEFVPPGPDNPMGTHALYLSWTYYRVHGTHDTRKIGRRSSNGCIGLYNEHIAELFAHARVGTQVLLI